MEKMPTWEGFLSLVLGALNDGETRNRREINDLTADHAGLTSEQRDEVLSSGMPRYANRIGWALSYLTNVGALDRPVRGQYRITDGGRQVLRTQPGGLRERDFESFAADPKSVISEYVASTTKRPAEINDQTDPTDLDPIEQVVTGIDRIHSAVAADLLSRLHTRDPAFFEVAVVKLLVAMGYGGADGTATVTSQSNDGGIDGIIDQDTLGISRVYVQAKRYAPDSSIDRPAVQSFVGALSGKADGGVFITTARFSKGARDYAEAVPTRVILIDGDRLAGLMIRYGVGVQERQVLKIVEIDEDFFE